MSAGLTESVVTAATPILLLIDLLEFADHRPECGSRDPNIRRCDCGFEGLELDARDYIDSPDLNA
jgi:hypothetical protein